MTAPDPPAVASVGAEAVDVDTLPPTRYLVMEVLAARYRLGENCWTFPTRLRSAIASLAEAGLVWDVGGNVPQTTRVMLTDAGKRAVLMAGYEPPAQNGYRSEIRAQVLAEVDAALRDWGAVLTWWQGRVGFATYLDPAASGVAADYLRDTLAGDGRQPAQIDSAPTGDPGTPGNTRTDGSGEMAATT